MCERPILMNGPMVRAILAGRKTQTRRVARLNDSGRVQLRGRQWHPHDQAARLACHFGQPGDRLWVRETTVRVEEHGYCGPVYAESDNGRACLDWGLAPAPDDVCEVEPHELKLRPAIHMPRSMCRLVLEITDVRVERLQAISEADAMADGIEVINGRHTFNGGLHESRTARESFQALWTSTGGDWGSNPWVWVIEFKRVAGTEGRSDEGR